MNTTAPEAQYVPGINHHAVAAVLERSNASKTDLLILIMIARFINAVSGQTWPSVDTLAELTGYSERTVRDSIGRLEESGELLVERRHNRTSVYTIPLLSGAEFAPSTHTSISNDIESSKDP